ncbi:MAG: hypothetical protein WC971_02450 [Coriobacteriia bacterium]
MSEANEDVESGGGDRFAVLNVFGLKLEVSNPRLAELLTMDAKAALTTDLRELASTPEQARIVRAEAEQAAPDVMLSPVTPHDDEEMRARAAFRQDVESLGAALGFDVSSDGVWSSSTGVEIVMRAVSRSPSFAAASHYVAEIAGRRTDIASPDATVLFVVDSQQTVDVFKVAIRQRRLYDQMRTVSVDNLREVAALHRSGVIDHAKAVILLAPIANIDVGEVLSVIRSAGQGNGSVVEA